MGLICIIIIYHIVGLCPCFMHISGIFSQCLYLQKLTDNKCSNRAVVVPQLVERSLPTPEVHGSNPVIGKKIHLMFSVNCIEKTKIKKGRDWPIF